MTGPALTDDQARGLARGITGGRQAVAAVYNQVAARTGLDLPDFKTLALGTGSSVEAYARALRTASEPDPPWLHALLAELSAQGMIDLQAALAESPREEALVTILPQNAAETFIEAQAFSAATSRTLGMAELVNAFNLAARRLCLIKAGGNRGTGFLIGPQTVLTNAHVMAALIDPATGKARDGAAKEITISFEALADTRGTTAPVAEDWLVGFSPMQTDMAIVDPTADWLDFCAIRLRGAPGRERGWYDLSKTGSLDNETDAFFVFQHPGAEPQRIGFATNTEVDTDTRFLRHKVGTAEGSSGGLCLDNRLRPIGLHHASIVHATRKDAKGKPEHLYNRAVRLSAIHAAHPTLGAPDPLLDEIARLSDGSSVVIGRESTQNTLRDMASGKAAQILIVRGGRKSGKSFTAALLRELFPFDSLKIIRLSPSDLTAAAVGLARLILERAGMDLAAIDAAFSSTALLTTGAATVADVFTTLKSALLGMAAARPVQPFTFWLVVDQLDTVTLPGIGTRELLDQIYNDAVLLKVVRVLLIGLPDVLTSVNPEHMATELLPNPDRVSPEEVERCLSRLMVFAGLVPAVGEPRRHAALVLGATDALDPAGRQSTQLAVLSGFISDAYMKAVETWQTTP